MEILLDCLPCMLKQALLGARLATKDIKIQEKIMSLSLEILSDYKSYQSSPELARAIHQVIKQETGIYDPYAKIKEKDLEAAKKAYATVKNFLSDKEDQLYWALKIAATGNNIDAAIYENIDMVKCINVEIVKHFTINDVDIFREKLVTAKSILIIGDNTGETIFDKVLIESISNIEFIYAVRSEAIINDVTMIDAKLSDLDRVATIVSTACNAPGLILNEASPEFLEIYHHADIIISKGQGNFEALSEEKNVFFLLKAKCPMIAGRLNVKLNDYILKYSGGE